MGSGPGTLTLFGTTWVLGVALLGLTVATRMDQRPFSRPGIAAGSLLIVAMGVVLFVDQTLVARLLGCL